MITRIEIENFKGIRDKVALDLKPITLLFGANSSGKSTVVHALHYALEVLRHHNLDADRTTLGGESVDLGGFRNLVHAHDIDRRISLLFEFDVEGSLADYTEGVSDMSAVYRGPPGPNLERADLADRLFTASVRIEVGWSRPLNAPQVFSYEVGTNGNVAAPVIRIEAGAGKGQTPTLVVQLDNSVFESPPEPDAPSELEDLVSEAGVPLKEGRATLPLYGQTSALPEWGRPLRLWLVDDMEPIRASIIELRRLLSRLAVGVGELLVAELERLLYIGPLRAVPSRNYRPPLTEDLARWAEGLGAWDVLYRRGADLVPRVSEWMKRLGTGHELDLRDVTELSGEAAGKLELLIEDLLASGGSLDQIQSPSRERSRKTEAKRGAAGNDVAAARAVLWNQGLKAIQSARHRDELVLIDERNGVAVRPSDVGVGISQVLPVVVAALYRGERGAGAFVAVEQPELHIHPKLQVALADLFVEQSSAGSMSDHWFLLETHSEHILLRLLRRIREGHAASTREQEDGARRSAPPGENDTDASGKASSLFTPDKLSIVYVQRGEDGTTKFVPLRVDERGEFLDVWPEGFFEERDPELFG